MTKEELLQVQQAIRTSLCLGSKRWLSREEAALYCGDIHPISFDRTIRKRLVERTLPGMSKPVFDKLEIDQVIDANRVTDPEIERLLSEPDTRRRPKKR